MSKVNKKELGKGIRALLGDTVKTDPVNTPPQTSGISEIKVAQIEINPFQPRTEFDESHLEELSESIATFGLIQPLTVRRLSQNTFQLISGERRLRAARKAGLTTVPAYVRKANDQEMLEMALVENIQRHDLNALEIAISFQRLIEECNLTHEEMSTRVGKKRSTVSNYLRLLKLPPGVQRALVEGKLSMGHARALLTLDSELQQLSLLKSILAEDLSVRATENQVRQITHQAEKKSSKANSQNPLERELTDHLAKVLSARVHLKRNKAGKGTISIHFANDDDLNRILDLIEGN